MFKTTLRSWVPGIFGFVFLVGMVHAQGNGEMNRLEMKRDSLERAIKREILTPADKQSLSQCARIQRQFLVEARQKNPEVALVDSTLRAIKLQGVGPDDPKALHWMQRKFSLEQSFDNAWQATVEGKRCLVADDARRKREELALKNHPGYQKILGQMNQQGLM